MNLKGLNNAWLDPRGNYLTSDKEFWGEATAWHENLALCVLRDFWGLEEKLDAFEKGHKKFSWSATKELEGMGWIRLHGFGGIDPKWVISINKRIPKRQEEAILKWCIANNKKYHDSLLI